MKEKNKKYFKILKGSGGGGGGPPPCYPAPPPDPHTPKEAEEGIIKDGKKLSRTETEVTDLICEGPIDGLVEGSYRYVGRNGRVGWDSVTFTPYEGGARKFLRSVYWRNVPLLDEGGNFNYSDINFRYDKGDQTTATSLVSDLSGNPTPQASRTLSIGDILRYNPPGTEDFAKNYDFKSTNISSLIISIKIDGLFDQQNDPNKDRQTFNLGCGQSVKISQTLGDIRDRSISFTFQIYKLTTTGNVLVRNISASSSGKITSGFIDTWEVNLSGYFQPDEENHLGWRVKIRRTSKESTTLNLRDACSVHAITEIFREQYIYPKTAIFKSLFTTEYFDEVPPRSYDVKLLKVKVPSNYDPIKKTYTGDWNGTFKSNLEWTDNPAWCYYDLLTNKRYGLGKYIKDANVDKWNLYRIAQYCDTIISDGYGGLEPRFTCNALISDFADAFSLLNDMASIFRGMSYYANGSIFAIADIPNEPIVLFTNANVENGDFNYSSSSRKVRNTVAVIRYNDMSNFAKPVVEYVEDPDGVRKHGIRKLEITAFGCTSQGQAYRLGRWALASEQLETETVDFTAGLEALYIKPGDIIKIQDHNRILHRLAGRILNISIENGQHTFILDEEFSKLSSYFSSNYPGNAYKLEILTPTFRTTGNMYSDFVSSYNRTEIQSGVFNLSNLSPITGYDPDRVLTKINTNKLFDTSNYVLQTGTIWSMQTAGGNFNLNAQTELYRVIGLNEVEPNKYSINAIEHNPSKYLFAESGISFSDAPITNPIENTILEASYPISLSFSTFNNLYLRYTINRATTTTNYSTKFWKVYAKAGSNFTTTELSRQLVNQQGVTVFVPNDSFLVATISVSNANQSITEEFVPRVNNTTYYFRVYGLNDNGFYSRTFAQGTYSYSSHLLNDFTNLIELNSFSYSTTEQRTSTAVNLNGPNLFQGKSINYSWRINNLASALKIWTSDDLEYRLRFGTGTFNQNTAISNTLGIKTFSQNGTEFENYTGIDSAVFNDVLTHKSLSGFWLAIDAKERTGNKYTSQESLSALPYSQSHGYLKGDFYNLPLNTRVNLNNAQAIITSSNNVQISIPEQGGVPADVGSTFIFFTDKANSTGFLKDVEINKFLFKQTRFDGYNFVNDMYNSGIQIREAFYDGSRGFATNDGFTNTSASGAIIKTGWLAFKMATNFESMLIDRYTKDFSAPNNTTYSSGPVNTPTGINFGRYPAGVTETYIWDNSGDMRNIANNLLFLYHPFANPVQIGNVLGGVIDTGDLDRAIKQTFRSYSNGGFTNTGEWRLQDGTLRLQNTQLILNNASYMNLRDTAYLNVGATNQSDTSRIYLNKTSIEALFHTHISFTDGISGFNLTFPNYTSGGLGNGSVNANSFAPRINITSGTLEMRSGFIGVDDINILFYKKSGLTIQGGVAGGLSGKTYAMIRASTGSGLHISGNLTITGGTGASIIAPSGYLHMTGNLGISGTTVISATAGTATLPTNPRGFLNVNINNSGFKVPYYNI